FFFQAEDGIRDYKVTGVQTCALPICLRALENFELVAALAQTVLGRIANARSRKHTKTFLVSHGSSQTRQDLHDSNPQCAVLFSRSEERRVGKECRVWWVS